MRAENWHQRGDVSRDWRQTSAQTAEKCGRRFKISKVTTAGVCEGMFLDEPHTSKSAPPPEDQPLYVSTTDLRKILLRVKKMARKAIILCIFLTLEPTVFFII